VAILPAKPNTVVYGKLGLNKWRRRDKKGKEDLYLRIRISGLRIIQDEDT